jgi:hypothetical protein
LSRGTAISSSVTKKADRPPSGPQRGIGCHGTGYPPHLDERDSYPWLIIVSVKLSGKHTM